MRLRIVFTGRVQGVGFRVTTAAIAQRHRVAGFVRNQPDGTVLLEAQADPGLLDAMLDELRTAMVRNIRSEDRTPMADDPADTTFAIR
ncbi:MAG: acylphosphatase [Phycisphaerales bacterium]|nr:acylphosphatase [Phycisphaerales bacterium]